MASVSTQKKRRKQTRPLEASSGPNQTGASSPWKDLPKDVVLSIFKRLDVKDVIVGAPLCCTSWYKASKDSFLWRDIDLSIFDKKGLRFLRLGQLLEFVVNRSAGLLNSINFYSLVSVDDIQFVAERFRGLKHFTFRGLLEEPIKTEEISKAIEKLRELEGMDITERFISSNSVLKQISECCPNFVKLKVYHKLSKDAASLISTSLPKLKFLDLSDTEIHRKDLLVILKGCTELESLDITGCGKINSNDVEIFKICRRLKEFKFDDESDVCPICVEEKAMCREEKNEDSDGEGEDSDEYCNSEVSYVWLCDHDVMYSTYILGTQELIDELYQQDQDIGLEKMQV